MTELLKTNPIALRHCLLYEFLQGNSAEKALLDFQRTVGKNVMNKEEIQILFRRFAKGKFYKNSKKHDQVAAKDIFQSDKKALRTCILYLSLKSQKKTEENRYLFRFNPSFVMYEEFRKVIGEDVMEYREFDFWFYRFLNGEFDLDFERDNDKKVYELSNMPLDVMEKVVEYLDITDRLFLAKTSRSLREFTEAQKLVHKKIVLLITPEEAFVRLSDRHRIDYLNDDYDNVLMFKGEKKRTIRNAPHWKLALLDLKSALKFPKLQLKKLQLMINLRDVLIELKPELRNAFEDSFPCEIHVKNVTLQVASFKTVLRILPYLKPGILEEISIETSNCEEEQVAQIVEMEQWKQAKKLIFSVREFCGSIRHLVHFNHFELYSLAITVDGIRLIKEICLKSPDFRECLIKCPYYPDGFHTIIKEFEEYIPVAAPYFYHYKVPNSEEYFEIDISPYAILIARQHY